MELNMVPSGKSLVVTKWTALAGKTRSSPATGATPPIQFPGVVQNLSPRNWPIHVFVSARAGAGVMPTASNASSLPTARGQDLAPLPRRLLAEVYGSRTHP